MGPGPSDWKLYSGLANMTTRMAQNGAPTHEIEPRAAGSRAAAWSAFTPVVRPQDLRCGIHKAHPRPRSTGHDGAEVYPSACGLCSAFAGRLSSSPAGQ